MARTPLPKYKPNTLGRLLGAICLVGLDLCEESNFSEAAGTAWRGQGKVSTGSSHSKGKALFLADPGVASGGSISLSTD